MIRVVDDEGNEGEALAFVAGKKDKIKAVVVWDSGRFTEEDLDDISADREGSDLEDLEDLEEGEDEDANDNGIPDFLEESSTGDKDKDT